MPKSRFWFCFALLFIFLGCEKLEVLSQDITDIEVTSGTYEASSITSADVLERAWQMANVTWTPVNPVPKRGGGYYSSGNSVSGVPYSSVKEINTYLFQDVSYHTFMTAVHNPNSVLYTEDISQTPYHGLNCAPYYGGVCSSTVMYALGVNIPYYANQIKEQPFMHQLEQQEVDSLRVCDVIWKPGHVQMVFDVEHRADTLYRITMFETSGNSAHITSYSAKGFKNLWTTYEYVAYRRENIIYTPKPDDFEGFAPIDYNDDLCPSKGDRAVYRTDDTITVNIFNSGYQEIVLQRGGREVMVDTYDGGTFQYTDLEPGIYECYLQGGGAKSQAVSFEVIRTDVQVETANNGNLLIRFSSDATADYAAVCDIHGSSQYYPISEEDRFRGRIVVPAPVQSERYCKVVFRGEYGTMINRPIKVK